MANLFRGQIKGSFAGLCALQVDFGVNVAGAYLPDQALRAAHADLRFWNRLGADFQIVGDILKHDGGAHRHFGRAFVGRDCQPQTNCQNQRQELQRQVVQHVASQEVHACRSVSEEAAPASELRWGSARRGELSAASDSSSFCVITVGSVTGDI